jgi:hypothetical protein
VTTKITKTIHYSSFLRLAIVVLFNLLTLLSLIVRILNGVIYVIVIWIIYTMLLARLGLVFILLQNKGSY